MALSKSKIEIIDFGNPWSVPYLREVWKGGPRGSEHQIIGAVALAARGHDVTVYGQTKESFKIEGVKIEPLPNLEHSKADLSMFFIGHCARADWAPFQVPDKEILDIAKSLETPTLGFGYVPLEPAPAKWWSGNWGYLAFSTWHAKYMISKKVAAANIYYVGLPIHPDNLLDPDMAARRPFLPRCLYASSWDRGLENLLTMWPQIRAKVPEAELYVTYSDAKSRVIDSLKQDNVFFVGNLSFEKMKELYHSCHALLYPCEEDVETYCYSAAKAQLAGCVPVTYQTGALPEIVVDGGGITTTPDKFVSAAVSVLRFRPFWESRSRKCRTLQIQTPEEYAIRLERAWSEVGSHQGVSGGMFR